MNESQINVLCETCVAELGAWEAVLRSVTLMRLNRYIPQYSYHMGVALGELKAAVTMFGKNCLGSFLPEPHKSAFYIVAENLIESNETNVPGSDAMKDFEWLDSIPVPTLDGFSEVVAQVKASLRNGIITSGLEFMEEPKFMN